MFFFTVVVGRLKEAFLFFAEENKVEVKQEAKPAEIKAETNANNKNMKPPPDKKPRLT